MPQAAWTLQHTDVAGQLPTPGLLWSLHAAGITCCTPAQLALLKLPSSYQQIMVLAAVGLGWIPPDACELAIP